MPNLKISQLTDGNPAQSADLIPIARSGSNFYVTAGSIVSLFSVAPESIQNISISQTLTFAGGMNTLVKATGGSAGINLILPDATTCGGRIIRIILVDNGIGGVTISTQASQTISGYSSYGLTNQYQSISLESDNANWFVIATATV